MAKIYCKITRQDIDYYLVWNTYYEKPYTIPMDLATFMVYLTESESSFCGIISSWKKLKLHSTSLSEIISTSFWSVIEYDYLCSQTDDGYIKNTAIENNELSKLIYKELDIVSDKYDEIIKSNTLLENLLLQLYQDFSIFLKDQIQNRISMLPKCFYNNIDDLYDKVYDQIASEKKDDFLCFIYRIEIPQKSEVEWYSKLLYSKNIEWHNIPMVVRANYLITDSNIKIKKENKSPFLRNIDNVAVNKYSPSRQDLLGYYNHLIGEKFNFAIELKNYLEELGFIDESNFLTLSNLNYLIDNELLNSDEQFHRLPNELVNFIDAEGGRLLPPIYDGFFKRQGLYVFYKYNNQLIDVYTENCDLVFSNLDDIDIFLINDEFLVTYEDNKGDRHFKKVIVKRDNPIQIWTIPPLDFASFG